MTTGLMPVATMDETFLLDVNVLLALSLPTHQHHGAATQWLEPRRRWATTPMTEAGYVRLMINPRVTGFMITTSAALDALVTMREVKGHVFLPDDSTLAEPAVDLGALVGTKQVTDFHLINLAARAGLVLATLDASLARSVAVKDRRHLMVITP